MASDRVCNAGHILAPKIWLTRHGESMYNRLDLLGGDSGLSPSGQAYSELLPYTILARVPKDAAGCPEPVTVWTSTLQRTIQTAQHLAFPQLRWKALDEVDAGICDGLTYAQVAEKYPQEFAARNQDKLRYRYPSGESYLDVMQRLDPVVAQLQQAQQAGHVVIVSHQATLRALLGRITGKPQEDIPSLTIPQHTVMELTPMPDGTMAVDYFPIPVSGTHKEATMEGVHAHAAQQAERQATPQACISSDPVATTACGVDTLRAETLQGGSGNSTCTHDQASTEAMQAGKQACSSSAGAAAVAHKGMRTAQDAEQAPSTPAAPSKEPARVASPLTFHSQPLPMRAGSFATREVSSADTVGAPLVLLRFGSIDLEVA